jgi:hypothetical protein
MRMKAFAMGLVALCVAVGCAQAPVPEGDAEKPELTAADKALVLDEAPTDIPHPLYIDFNGKAELLGYALEPAGVAAPGSKLSLKLYWRSTGKLDAGYLPFTELLTPEGKRIDVDGSGPLRKGALVPANWELNKVYVDELDFVVPPKIDVARFSIVVGFKTAPIAPEEPAVDDDKKADKKPEKASEANFGSVYLSVLSGPADSKYGGIIATLETGATPGALRAQEAAEAKAGKRGDGAPGVKRLPGKLPASAKPRPAQPAQ